MTSQFARDMAARTWASAKHAYRSSLLPCMDTARRVWWRQASRDDMDRAFGWLLTARSLERQ